MERIWKKMIGALGFTLCMALAACSDYLDVSNEIAESLDLEAVFCNPAYTRQWHANLFNCISEYSCTGGNNASGFTNVWSSLCGETLISSGPSSRLMEAGYNSGNAPLHRWWVLYREIRDAFIFLKRVTPLGAVEDEQQLTEESVRRMKAEAKFLIAYSYFSLFELYGPVPLLTEEVDPESKDLNFPRATVDELVDYIDRLLEEVIQSGDLPPTLINAAIPDGNERYNLNEIVRPTRSAAIALRAKLWVYAASPLFNGGYAEALEVKNNDGEYLFPPYDPEKWKIAKKRLEEVLEDAEACGYRLYKVYQTDGSIDADRSVYEVFQAYNDEIIWATGRNYYHTGSQDGVMEENTTPRDLYKGWAHVCVTQESVDGFFMKDGLTIDDPGTGYDESGFTEVVNPCNDRKRTDKNIFTMYADREPRFYAAVTYEGKSWHVQPQNKASYTVGFAKGEGNDRSKAENPYTGYMLYKFKYRSLQYYTRAADSGKNRPAVVKQWSRPSILLRLADFYLYYAEVCNEIDPSDTKIITYLDKVRKRAGIPGYQELANEGKKNIIGDQEKQRWAIQRERQVELFCEGQRYFDIRRWMTADDANNKRDQQLFRTGMDMQSPKANRIGAGSFYNRVNIETRAWNRAMLLYPVPYNEVQKSKLFVQNPLW